HAPRMAGEVRRKRLSHPPPTGLQHAADNIGLAVAVEIAYLDVDPGHIRAPRVPDGEIKRVAAGTQSRPPPAGFQHAAGEVRLAVAIEVADVDIDPGDGGGPSAPHGAVEGVAERTGHPPLTGWLHAAGNVVLAVAGEVADFHVHPVDGRGPTSPHAPAKGRTGG